MSGRVRLACLTLALALIGGAGLALAETPNAGFGDGGQIEAALTSTNAWRAACLRVRGLRDAAADLNACYGGEAMAALTGTVDAFLDRYDNYAGARAGDRTCRARDAAAAETRNPQDTEENLRTSLDGVEAAIQAMTVQLHERFSFEQFVLGSRSLDAVVGSDGGAAAEAARRQRLAACLRVRERAGEQAGRTSALLRAEEAAPHQARKGDELRKAAPEGSGAGTSLNGLLEQAGSPDKLVATVLAGLGAAAKTEGIQTVLTLNLASLFVPNEARRLAQPAALRTLFLRATLPLNTTSDAPQPSVQAGSATEGATRFSFVLGGSLYDATDPRLPGNADCYRLVLAYVPFGLTEKGDTGAAEVRKQYYDVCNRLAIYQQRVAFRLGLGLINQRTGASSTTEVEVLAGTLVWSPQPWLQINAAYQAYLKPARIDSVGGGLSLGGNLGGGTSGVNAWARLGLDVILLGVHPEGGGWDMDLRISPTVRANLFNHGNLLVAAGPRIVTGRATDTGVLATVALSWDADTMINSLLAPPPAPEATK